MYNEHVENISFLHSVMNFAYLDNLGLIILLIALGVLFMWIGYKASLWIIHDSRMKKIIGWIYFSFVNFIGVAFFLAMMFYTTSDLYPFFWEIFLAVVFIAIPLLGWIEFKMLLSGNRKKKITGQTYLVFVSLIAAVVLIILLSLGVVASFTHDLLYPAHLLGAY